MSSTVSIRSKASSSTTAAAISLDDRRVMRIELDCGAPGTGLTPADAAVVEAAIDEAVRSALPIVAIVATNGVSIDGGLDSVAGWGRAAKALVRASGVVPTVFIAAGPVVSGPALLLGLADVTIFTEDAYAFVSGPAMVESFTGVPISNLALGGSGAHSRSSGVASLVVTDLDSAMDAAAAVLGHLPDHVDLAPPMIDSDDPVDRLSDQAGSIVPATATGSYDVRSVIRDVFDDGEFLELRGSWAPNLVTGFASLGGQSVGIVANQTQALAGSIDIPASQKGARFVALCDAFNVPLITLVDTSGFLPGKDLEWRGMIRHGAQLAFAYARATVPRLGLILRKSYGGAYIVMDSRFMGNDLMMAWPTAEVAVMGAKGAVEILHRKATPEERVELEAAYAGKHLTPYPTAERGSISMVIEPDDTRRELAAGLEMLLSKREKLRPRRHDNTPL
ncbi:MAG: acyl-CoA carboxylase subunit beta [Acidimicrobiales bacterium]